MIDFYILRIEKHSSGGGWKNRAGNDDLAGRSETAEAQERHLHQLDSGTPKLGLSDNTSFSSC